MSTRTKTSGRRGAMLGRDVAAAGLLCVAALLVLWLGGFLREPPPAVVPPAMEPVRRAGIPAVPDDAPPVPVATVAPPTVVEDPAVPPLSGAAFPAARPPAARPSSRQPSPSLPSPARLPAGGRSFSRDLPPPLVFPPPLLPRRWIFSRPPWWDYRAGYPVFTGLQIGEVLWRDDAGGRVAEPDYDAHLEYAEALVAAFAAMPPAAPEAAVSTAAPLRARSLWDWDLSAESSYSRQEGSSTLTTLTPVTLSVTRAFAFRSWRSFRPSVSAGAGVLRQTIEGRDIGPEPRQELLPLLRAGLGAEWIWSGSARLKIQYDYMRLPVESSIAPDLSDHLHSVNLGVELRF